MKVAVFVGASYVTVPVTGVAPAMTVKFAEMIVAGFMAALKAAFMAPLMATPVAELPGKVEITVGCAPVVNIQAWELANAFPATLFAPVVIVAV